VFTAQRQKPLLRRARCRHLGQHIALSFGWATDIMHDDTDLFIIRPFSGKEPQRWQPQALLKTLSRISNIRTWPAASDIGPMGKADRKANKAAFGEDGS